MPMKSNHQLRGSMNFMSFSYILMKTIGMLTAAQDICSCTPLIYEWKLDFNKTCSPRNVTVGPNEGIMNVFCSIEAATKSNTTVAVDLKPVKVIEYQIIELNLELLPLKSESAKNVSLMDGDLITFSSLTAVDPSQYSGGFQVSLLAVNSVLQDIVLEWLVRYSNLCEKIPYSIGDSIGWMVNNGGTPSRQETCQSPSAEPSQSPTQLSTKPSIHPSDSTTIKNSSFPSFSPSFHTNNPSSSPSDHPTTHPSNRPSLRKSTSPSAPPSALPSSSKPTIEPSSIATFTPSEFSMSYSYSFDYQMDGMQLARWLDEYDFVTEFGRVDVKKGLKKKQ